MHSTPVEHLDVLVIGAGLSGIGAARYLRTELPHLSLAVLEGRETLGGTWDLFRYPGIRSDSDLYTFGYEFKPWRDRDAIATAPKILDYLRETVEENGLAPLIRYRHKVLAADWSSEDARWTVEVERTDSGERHVLTAGWLFFGTGYYRYDEGFTPELAGRDRFTGQVVHPQHWPEDLEYAGKRVVVVGSGATAVTLVPALAEGGAEVTLLQRTPTYVMPVPKEDKLALGLKRLLGDERGHAAARAKSIAQQRAIWLFCQKYPKLARRLIRRINMASLPEDFPVDVHFNPPYDPWDQRLCVVPDGDLFKAIKGGHATVVTDRIVELTERGLRLESGRELEADVIVTATGFTLQIVGGIALSVDGETVSFPDTTIYRSTMLSGVPNASIAIGYTNAPWTLKVGLVAEWLCRLLAHMEAQGQDTAVVVPEPGLPTRPLLDFGAGYVQRSLAELPKQGPSAPWVMSMNYYEDRRLLRGPEVFDRHLRLTGPADREGRPAYAEERR